MHGPACVQDRQRFDNAAQRWRKRISRHERVALNAASGAQFACLYSQSRYHQPTVALLYHPLFNVPEQEHCSIVKGTGMSSGRQGGIAKGRIGVIRKCGALCPSCLSLPDMLTRV